MHIKKRNGLRIIGIYNSFIQSSVLLATSILCSKLHISGFGWLCLCWFYAADQCGEQQCFKHIFVPHTAPAQARSAARAERLDHYYCGCDTIISSAE